MTFRKNKVICSECCSSLGAGSWIVEGKQSIFSAKDLQARENATRSTIVRWSLMSKMKTSLGSSVILNTFLRRRWPRAGGMVRGGRTSVSIWSNRNNGQLLFLIEPPSTTVRLWCSLSYPVGKSDYYSMVGYRPSSLGINTGQIC
jgi:hypothetical protein